MRKGKNCQIIVEQRARVWPRGDLGETRVVIGMGGRLTVYNVSSCFILGDDQVISDGLFSVIGVGHGQFGGIGHKEEERG